SARRAWEIQEVTTSEVRKTGETTRHATIDHTAQVAEQDYSFMVD
ncbi:Uncharacterized protein ALO94_00737, partial [Pseudomonas syringae pv. spinaceae]